MDTQELEYVGFWARLGASVLDSVLVIGISGPILYLAYGAEAWTSDALVKGPVDFLMSWTFPVVAVIVFWVLKQATPGKMAVSARIVDAQTGANPSTGQCIGRYLGYFVSTIPLLLGFVWVAFDRRKQGWHDKLAGTVVVRTPKK